MTKIRHSLFYKTSSPPLSDTVRCRWAVNAVCFAFTLMGGKKRFCGPFTTLLIAVMLVVAGGVANDYGRVAYAAHTINSNVPGTLVDIPDSAKAALAGCIMYILFDLAKLMALFNPAKSTTLAYQSKV